MQEGRPLVQMVLPASQRIPDSVGSYVDDACKWGFQSAKEQFFENSSKFSKDVTNAIKQLRFSCKVFLFRNGGHKD